MSQRVAKSKPIATSPPATESPPLEMPADFELEDPAASSPKIPINFQSDSSDPLTQASILGMLLFMLGDPDGKKLQVLYLLSYEEIGVNDLASRLNMNNSNLSQWLTRMKMAGILYSYKQGHRKIYKLESGLPQRITGLVNQVLGSNRVTVPVVQQTAQVNGATNQS